MASKNKVKQLKLVCDLVHENDEVFRDFYVNKQSFIFY